MQRFYRKIGSVLKTLCIQAFVYSFLITATGESHATCYVSAVQQLLFDELDRNFQCTLMILSPNAC